VENYHKAGLFREGQNLEVCTRQLPKCLSPNWFHRLGCDNVDESILQWKKFLMIMEQCIPKATLGLGLLKHLYSNQEMYLRDLGDVTMLKSIERIRMRNWVMTMLWNRKKLFFQNLNSHNNKAVLESNKQCCIHHTRRKQICSMTTSQKASTDHNLLCKPQTASTILLLMATPMRSLCVPSQKQLKSWFS